MRYGFISIFLLLYIPVAAQFQGLLVNEFSQGDQGSKEYIELLVSGKRTCNDSTADIRGWIVDDQNGWYGTVSLTQGHYRFSDILNWAAVPIGSLILLYNSAANGKNNSITLSDDPTDANKDFIYVVPINSSAFLEEYDNEPSSLTGPVYVYPPATTTLGYTGTSNLWIQHIALNNGSDVICTISPQDRTKHYFSIGYGYPILPGFRSPSVAVAAVNAANSCYLTDSNYTTAASWIIAAVPVNETPGFPNDGINTLWIQAMRITPKPVATYTMACSNGPYTFFSQTFTNTGAYTVLTNNVNACVDTNRLYIVIKKAEVIDTAGCDSLIYKGIKYLNDTTMVDNILSTLINCDSLVRTVNISIKESSSSVSQACVGVYQTYIFNSLALTTSGNYAVTLTNAKGCDSIAKLFLLVTILQTSALSGCGAVIYNGYTYTSSTIVYDTVKSQVLNCDSVIRQVNIQVHTNKTTNLTACANEGDTYLFNSQPITTPGLYITTLNTTTGCDSIVKLYIIFKKTVTQNISGCDSVVHNGIIYYTATNLEDTLRSVVSNCDSIVTITSITINPLKHTYAFACSALGQVYNFNGQQIFVSGTYTTTYSTSACDSIVHLNLTVVTEQLQTIQGCGAVINNGILYTSSTIIRDTVKSVVTSCDSIYKLIRIVIKPLPSSSKTVCIKEGETFNFNGQLLLVTGNYSTTYLQSGQCDSTVYLYLLVSRQQEQTLSGCSAIIFNGISYTSTITITDTVRSMVASCDSIHQVTNVIIRPKPVSNVWACITQGHVFEFNGQSLIATGNYSTVYLQPGGCDSTVKLYLVVSRRQSQSIAGCDSVFYNGTTYTSSTVLSDTIRSTTTSCDSIINVVTIQINKKPSMQISSNATICKGENIRLGASSPGGNFDWIGFGQMDSITVQPVITTSYTAIVTDANGCTNSASVTVFVQEFNLELFATPSSVLSGRPVFLQTVSVFPYRVTSWQPTTIFINQTSKTQSFIADSSLQIIVAGETAFGCRDTALAAIIVIPLDDVYIPSGFTPNGDGKNEVVRVFGTGIKELDFKIFNRWGQMIFYTKDKGKGWDGKIAGVLQPAGTYVYVVKVKKTNGQVVEKKGTIVLIR
ncbi:MAG: type sorting protein [Flavisolibacter sp.]|nr:type sorting protein [Flavisolibacter sp.]